MPRTSNRSDRGQKPEKVWYLTTSAAEYLGVSRRTLQKYVAAGRLRGYRDQLSGCMVRFHRDDLDAYARGEVPPPRMADIPPKFRRERNP